jgi:hypothetical protein
MRYALVIDGAISRYPYTFNDLRKDNPQVSFPQEPSDAFLAEYGVHPVQSAAKPAYDLTKNIVEGAPAYNAGSWWQTWVEVAASPEEIASRREAATQEAEREAAKLDAWVISFLGMTPSGAEQYVLNNVANLSQLRAIVGKLAYATRVLVRREFGR